MVVYYLGDPAVRDILGTRLSETVCVAVGLIGVKGGRGLFIV